MQEIINFSDCEYSIRHGSYGGRAGDKDGILYQNEFYLIKYPKPARQLKGIEDMNYITSPLSEYIGSHIYEILGFDVHKT
ncbi:MAG: CtkA family protein, partial [Ruminococcus flavefaciens]|nr:CtkA family protein [Ruminococcus flavefaciens]